MPFHKLHGKRKYVKLNDFWGTLHTGGGGGLKPQSFDIINHYHHIMDILRMTVVLHPLLNECSCLVT
jgi:hypothetical protein